jgi:isopentenyl diphosphate isomerase/L-lactate dehydrogenase-like FMN-dependent dehydrogenase
VASSLAAHEFGTIHVISSSTQPALEETAACSPSPKIFQLYVDGDWAWVQDTLSRAKAAGYVALALTVDNAIYSRRERPMQGGYTPPTRRNPPSAKYRAGLTWEMMDRIREQFAGLPFLLKGVQSPEDAAIAVNHGVNVIWVSNHGGRQLDFGQASIDVLPEVVAAVGNRAQIVMDGGVQRGTDVLKAYALGARAVALGKMQGWGLGAGGTAGVVRMLEILEHEMQVAMGLMGITSLDQLTPASVTKAEPVAEPHEMSTFVDLQAGRLS